MEKAVKSEARKRKIGLSRSSIPVKTSRLELENCDHVCCSKFVDLEDVNLDLISTTTTVGGERIETRKWSEGEMPSDAELEEFFSSAEKKLQEKIIDKYNYDIVNDQPLRGRYEWNRDLHWNSSTTSTISVEAFSE